ncbi:hypothetical protein NE237_032301 [Protea cynaroides]|uniref:Retrotransposon Copia-like N-terminal domain-containing protein n=1 Tax=Protea cynaroides TaxID=273540 RepID=A0A9Q0R396_9MAGN|nr:hypothetical protein NE237_032301 [Protea cynaroides]
MKSSPLPSMFASLWVIFFGSDLVCSIFFPFFLLQSLLWFPHLFYTLLFMSFTQSSHSSPTLSSISPSVLYPSDNPGHVLVSKSFDGNNYPTWKQAMRVLLGDKNKYGFVDGTYKHPIEGADAIAAWDQSDLMVMFWLYNSLNRSFHDSVLYTSRDLWLDLENCYACGNGPRLYELKRQIALLRQNTMTVSDYFSSLKILWDEIGSHLQSPACDCGAHSLICPAHLKPVDSVESEKVFQFLLGLNDVYSTVRTQILTMEPLPVVGKAYSLVLQEEQYRGLSTQQVIPFIQWLLQLATIIPNLLHLLFLVTVDLIVSIVINTVITVSLAMSFMDIHQVSTVVLQEIPTLPLPISLHPWFVLQFPLKFTWLTLQHLNFHPLLLQFHIYHPSLSPNIISFCIFFSPLLLRRQILQEHNLVSLPPFPTHRPGLSIQAPPFIFLSFKTIPSPLFPILVLNLSFFLMALPFPLPIPTTIS